MGAGGGTLWWRSGRSGGGDSVQRNIHLQYYLLSLLECNSIQFLKSFLSRNKKI